MTNAFAILFIKRENSWLRNFEFQVRDSDTHQMEYCLLSYVDGTFKTNLDLKSVLFCYIATNFNKLNTVIIKTFRME